MRTERNLIKIMDYRYGFCSETERNDSGKKDIIGKGANFSLHETHVPLYYTLTWLSEAVKAIRKNV